MAGAPACAAGTAVGDLSRMDFVAVAAERLLQRRIGESEALAAGWLDPYPDGRMHLDWPINRGAAARALYRMLLPGIRRRPWPRPAPDVRAGDELAHALAVIGGAFPPAPGGRFLPDRLLGRAEFEIVLVALARHRREAAAGEATLSPLAPVPSGLADLSGAQGANHLRLPIGTGAASVTGPEAVRPVAGVIRVAASVTTTLPVASAARPAPLASPGATTTAGASASAPNPIPTPGLASTVPGAVGGGGAGDSGSIGLECTVIPGTGTPEPAGHRGDGAPVASDPGTALPGAVADPARAGSRFAAEFVASPAEWRFAGGLDRSTASDPAFERVARLQRFVPAEQLDPGAQFDLAAGEDAAASLARQLESLEVQAGDLVAIDGLKPAEERELTQALTSLLHLLADARTRLGDARERLAAAVLLDPDSLIRRQALAQELQQRETHLDLIVARIRRRLSSAPVAGAGDVGP